MLPDLPVWLYAVAIIGPLCCISLERRNGRWTIVLRFGRRGD